MTPTMCLMLLVLIASIFNIGSSMRLQGTMNRLIKAASASACGVTLLTGTPAIATDAFSAAFKANSEMNEKKALPEPKASTSDRAKQREAIKKCRELGIGDKQKECLAKLLPPSAKDANK